MARLAAARGGGAPAEMQIMYGLMGERRLTEWEVDWLPGYLGSRPVRVGNAAHRQFQLDVYGELMDTFEQARKGGLALTDSGWALQRALVTMSARWHEPDNGIWEMRGPPRISPISKVMAWVASIAPSRRVELHGLTGPVEEWRECARRSIPTSAARGFDQRVQHLSRGLRRQDARCQPPAARPGRLCRAGRSAFRRHRRGDRA